MTATTTTPIGTAISTKPSMLIELLKNAILINLARRIKQQVHKVLAKTNIVMPQIVFKCKNTMIQMEERRCQPEHFKAWR
jgi:hypothetical protein